MSMAVKDVRHAKHELEVKIRNLLNDFEEEYSTKIIGISFKNTAAYPIFESSDMMEAVYCAVERGINFEIQIIE